MVIYQAPINDDGEQLKRPMIVLVGAAAAVLICTTAAPAMAEEDKADELSDTIDSAQPHFLDVLPGAQATETLPSRPDEGVAVGKNNVSISFDVSNPSPVRVELAENAVAFEGNDSSHVVVDKGDGVVGLATVIEAGSQQDRFTFDLSIPDGARADAGQAGGLIFSLSGKAIGGVLPPWAKDADGSAVATHYELSGSTLTQVVDHEGRGFSYPIVADPTYYGESLIEKVTAGTASKGKETHVYTTQWFRTSAALPSGSIVKAQIVDEYKRVVPSTYDTTGARQQVSCHAFGPFLKNPWNIELWRPTVGEAATIAAACNPS